jgi:hypothetical protein
LDFPDSRGDANFSGMRSDHALNGTRFPRNVLPLKKTILNPVLSALDFGDLSYGKSRSLANPHVFNCRP